MKTCAVKGCQNNVHCRGWCRLHYIRWQRHGDPLGGRLMIGKKIEWLKSHITYRGPDCLFANFVATKAYWGFQLHGVQYSAHRWMCEQVNGPAPDGMHAAHSCGNGHLGCVNPSHLSWKTPLENSTDRYAHGTIPYGDRSGVAKITDAEVEEIMRAPKSLSHSTIARQFGVSRAYVGMILNGKARKNVTRKDA